MSFASRVSSFDLPSGSNFNVKRHTKDSKRGSRASCSSLGVIIRSGIGSLEAEAEYTIGGKSDDLGFESEAEDVFVGAGLDEEHEGSSLLGAATEWPQLRGGGSGIPRSGVFKLEFFNMSVVMCAGLVMHSCLRAWTSEVQQDLGSLCLGGICVAGLLVLNAVMALFVLCSTRGEIGSGATTLLTLHHVASLLLIFGWEIFVVLLGKLWDNPEVSKTNALSTKFFFQKGGTHIIDKQWMMVFSLLTLIFMVLAHVSTQSWGQWSPSQRKELRAKTLRGVSVMLLFSGIAVCGVQSALMENPGAISGESAWALWASLAAGACLVVTGLLGMVTPACSIPITYSAFAVLTGVVLSVTPAYHLYANQPLTAAGPEVTCGPMSCVDAAFWCCAVQLMCLPFLALGCASAISYHSDTAGTMPSAELKA